MISSGEIGDAIQGTSLSFSGTLQGIVAAIGQIQFARSISSTHVFQNLTSISASYAAIQAIWTNNGIPLSFDISPLDLQGLTLILKDLNALTIGSNGSLTGTTP